MQRFFLPSGGFEGGVRPDVGGVITIRGDDAHHIAHVLRMGEGERVLCCDMSRTEYDCVITGFERDAVLLHVNSCAPCETEPPARSYLYQALPKSDKMDVIVQKAVECGVYEIIPFISERCVSRPDADGAKKKVVRWRKIAAEAAKQCGRGIQPQVRDVITFPEALAEMSAAVRHGSDNATPDGEHKAKALSFICYEGDGTKPLGEVLRRSDGERYGEYRFMIGSEGGFSAAEFERCTEAGLSAAGLGRRILRCETAPSFVLACICYEDELMGR